MEPPFRDNGTAQLLIPLLGRVSAFPRQGEGVQFPGGLKGLRLSALWVCFNLKDCPSIPNPQHIAKP